MPAVLPVLKLDGEKQSTATAPKQAPAGAPETSRQKSLTLNVEPNGKPNGHATPRGAITHHHAVSSRVDSGDKVQMSKRMRIYYNGTQKEREHAAACHMQAVIRGNAERKAFFSERGFRINLKYEMSILKRRTERRGLLFGCAQHMTYILLLTIMILVQSGGPKTNFELKTSVSEYIENVETPDGSTFEDVATITVRLSPRLSLPPFPPLPLPYSFPAPHSLPLTSPLRAATPLWSIACLWSRTSAIGSRKACSTPLKRTAMSFAHTTG